MYPLSSLKSSLKSNLNFFVFSSFNLDLSYFCTQNQIKLKCIIKHEEKLGSCVISS